MRLKLTIEDIDQDDMQNIIDAPMMGALLRRLDEEMRVVVHGSGDSVAIHHAIHWRALLQTLAEEYGVRIW